MKTLLCSRSRRLSVLPPWRDRASAQAVESGYERGTLAVAAMERGDWARAEQLLTDKRLNADDPARLINLGQVYWEQGRAGRGAQRLAPRSGLEPAISRWRRWAAGRSRPSSSPARRSPRTTPQSAAPRADPLRQPIEPNPARA